MMSKNYGTCAAKQVPKKIIHEIVELFQMYDNTDKSLLLNSEGIV